MRNYLLAAVAAAAIATPALARDGSPYVGIEGGLMIVEDLVMDVDVNDGTTTTTLDNAFTIDFKPSLDADLIAGYDFGSFRLEGELGYKRLRIDGVRLSGAFGSAIDSTDDDFDIDERGSVVSLMANGMFDFGDEDGWNGFIGAGIGRARVKFAGDNDSALAYQGIAGVRYAITPNIDLGLKYRYFHTAKLEFEDDFSDGVDTFGLSTSGDLVTHSLLASVVYNFARPVPVIVEPVIAPPPPPAPAPATQTCYDGSVILATDICPQPPMPAPAPERG